MEAHPSLDQWLPVYQPFRASWQTALGSCRCFLHPLYSFRTVGFPQYGWKPAWSSCALPKPFRAAFDAGPAVHPFLAISYPGVWNRGCTHRPLAQHGLSYPHLQTLLRPDPPACRTPPSLASLLTLVGLCPKWGRSPRLPFFSLSCVLRPCRYPYPADWPVSFDGSSTGHASLRPFCRDSAVSDIPLTGFREGPLSRRQFSRYVAACTLARATGQSPLDSFPESNRLARLRQSLLQQGSPPAKVCYYYSAQPSIAEAGFAPARMSKTEGCTQNHDRTESLRTGPNGT